MAGNSRRTGGAAANGFAPRTLLKDQTEALRDNGYPVLPDMRVAYGFVIGVNGVPVTKPLTRTSRGFAAAVNTHYWRDLTPEQRQDPRWDPRNPANHGRYEAAFQRAYEEDFNRWDGPGSAPTDKNVVGREAFKPITPLDLVPLPLQERVNMEASKRAIFLRKIHEKTNEAIEKKGK